MDYYRFIQLIKEKNPNGLNEIYEAYAPVIYLFIFQVTNKEDLTEELLIKSFLKVWNDPSELTIITDPFLYLLQKASTTILEHTNDQSQVENKIKKCLRQVLKRRPILNSIIPGPSHNLPEEPVPISITAA